MWPFLTSSQGQWTQTIQFFQDTLKWLSLTGSQSNMHMLPTPWSREVETGWTEKKSRGTEEKREERGWKWWVVAGRPTCSDSFLPSPCTPLLHQIVSGKGWSNEATFNGIHIHNSHQTAQHHSTQELLLHWDLNHISHTNIVYCMYISGTSEHYIFAKTLYMTMHTDPYIVQYISILLCWFSLSLEHLVHCTNTFFSCAAVSNWISSPGDQ